MKKGSLGTAPDLTGYGSAEWIAGILRNPADRAIALREYQKMLMRTLINPTFAVRH